MSSSATHSTATPPSSISDGFHVTDHDIAVLSRFLVRSTGKQGGLPLEYPRRSLDSNQSGDTTHAPLPGTAGFERSRKVLDALVAIAGCGGSQVLALSVSFGPEVRIVIAQNEERPPPKIEAHLRSVWAQLAGLASAQRTLRRRHGLPDTLDSHGKSPKAAESHSALPKSAAIKRLKKMKEELHDEIHRHCYMKSKQRIVKYLSPIAEFHRFYLRARSQLDPTLVIADIVFCLLKLFNTVTGYNGPFDSSGAPAEMDWSDLATRSSLLLKLYLDNTTEVMAKIEDVMTLWRKRSEVQANRSWRRFDLLRALEKTVTLPRQIQELVNFAYSPRLRSILAKTMNVIALPSRSVTLPEPSAAEMRHIVERAFNSTGFATTRRIDEAEELQDIRAEQLEKVDATLTPAVAKHTVHAEYNLLLYHHSETHSHNNPPPFQYIAVNKLSCFSCWGAYQAYNRMTGRIFSLRGSHSRLYFPTCPTTHLFHDELGQAMRAYLYSELVNIYSEHLNHIQDARNRMADSSVASGGSGTDTDNRLQVDSDDVAAARLQREQEEAAMDMTDD